MNRFVPLLLFLLAPAAPAVADDQQPVGVRVVNLNLWHKKTDLRERTKATRRVLQALQPDLIGLQEVSGSWWRKNRAKLLARGLGYAYRYAKSDGIRPVFAEGLAVLSRRPLLAVDRKKLPHSKLPPFERRFVQWTETTVEGGAKVVLFNTHLTHHDGYGWQVERLEQALVALDVIARVALARDLPAVFVGDFNSTPDHLAIRALTGRLLGGRPPLLDAAAAAGATTGPKNPYTPGEKAERIDYVLVLQGTSRPLVPLRAGRIGVKRALSDHYGLVVDLVLGPKRASAGGPRGARGALAGDAATSRSATPAARAARLRARIARLQGRIARIRTVARSELEARRPGRAVEKDALRALVLSRVLAELAPR